MPPSVAGGLQFHDPSTTSLSLLRRAKRHEPEAWNRVVRIYSPLVYRWCRLDVELQPADVADIVQEVFRSVWLAIEDFRRDRPGDSFRYWLRAITLNKIRDHFRRHRDRPAASGGSVANNMLAQVEDRLANQSGDEVESENILVLHAALRVIEGDFEKATWTAFWSFAIEGHSTAEIAERVGMTPHAVRQACYRVRKRLKDEMQDMLDETSES